MTIIRIDDLFAAPFDAIIQATKNPEIVDLITYFRATHKYVTQYPDGKFHPLIVGLLTYVGNMAKDDGEQEVVEIARSARDEFKRYCIEWEEIEKYENW